MNFRSLLDRLQKFFSEENSPFDESKKRLRKVVLTFGIIAIALLLTVVYRMKTPVMGASARTTLSNPSFGPKVIHVTQQIIKDYPLSLISLQEITPSEDVSLPGRVQFDPSQVAIVGARAYGRVASLTVKEADTVERSQILATLQSSELAQAEATHLKMLSRFELMSQQEKRSRELFDEQIVSAKEHGLSVMEFKAAKAELESSRIQLRNLGLEPETIALLEREQVHSGILQIRSPLKGVVMESKVSLGQLVKAEDTLFTVGNLDRVWIVLDVYEKDIDLINEGASAEVFIHNSTELFRTADAKVARISHTIDTATRSAKVWLEVKNSEGELRFGQAVSARIRGIDSDFHNRKVRALPPDAIHQIEGKSTVFVQTGELTFEAKEVTTGWTSDQWVEIKSGLQPNEFVVSKGSFVLKSEFLKH